MTCGAGRDLKMLSKPCVYALLGIALLSFVIGWIFPVEGPLDSTYDDFIKVKKSRQKGVAAPTKKPQKEIIVMDEDEIELYYLVPSTLFGTEGN